MSYRNKTYVIFDGDNDMWAYSYMLGWKANDRIEFNFHDAHDIRRVSSRASEDTVKRALRERLSNTKQAIVLVGESTKNLYRFVRWEIETCIRLDLPIIAVNLNGLARQDDHLCPPILRDRYVVHVPFKMKIIRHALDGFPQEYHRKGAETGPRYYSKSIYDGLGLEYG